MEALEKKILEALKKILEYKDLENDYSQWILGLSLKKKWGEDKEDKKESYIARVVVKTSESPYVDGMDIEVDVVGGDVEVVQECFENTPELQGGTVQSSLDWILELEKACYIQIEGHEGRRKEDGQS